MGSSSQALPRAVVFLMASALPTTVSDEADPRRLRGTKLDSRSKLACLSPERVLQATDILLLSDLVDATHRQYKKIMGFGKPILRLRVACE
jgi:hypothetical protein